MTFVSRTAAAVFAAAGLLTATVGTPASAAPKGVAGAEETYRNMAYETCLDSDAKGAAYLHKCTGGPNQAWKPAAAGPDGAYRTFTNKATGRCLRTGPARDVTTAKCNSRDVAQQWKVLHPTGDTLQFKSVNTAHCLDAYRDAVFTSLCNTSGEHDAYQHWK